MILPDFMIRERGIFTPFSERSKQRGMSYGLSHAGYDVRITLKGMVAFAAGVVQLEPGGFMLASTLEHFDIPPDLLGIVHDKSTWARMGLAAQNTVIEPGWKGHLTLELTNHSDKVIAIHEGDPIAQIVFHQLAAVPERAYEGKYQNQGEGPQAARFE